MIPLPRARVHSLVKELGFHRPHCCFSLTQSCLTLCGPMHCHTTGFRVLHHLPEFAQIQVHWVGDALQPSHPLLSFYLLPSISPSIRVFSKDLFQFGWFQLFTSAGQSIEALASAAVLPVNIENCFPLGLTSSVSSQSKGALKTLFQHHSWKASICWCSVFFIVQLSHPYMTTGKTTAASVWTL